MAYGNSMFVTVTDHNVRVEYRINDNHQSNVIYKTVAEWLVIDWQILETYKIFISTARYDYLTSDRF